MVHGFRFFFLKFYGTAIVYHAQYFFEGVFEKQRFLDMLQNFICFNVDGANTFRVLAGYHQYFAVKRVIESTRYAAVTDGKGGVFWHAQSGQRQIPVHGVLFPLSTKGAGEPHHYGYHRPATTWKRHGRLAAALTFCWANR